MICTQGRPQGRPQQGFSWGPNVCIFEKGSFLENEFCIFKDKSSMFKNERRLFRNKSRRLFGNKSRRLFRNKSRRLFGNKSRRLFGNKSRRPFDNKSSNFVCLPPRLP
jgi:hypothetical protein